MTTIAALTGVSSVNLSDLLPVDQSPSGSSATKHASVQQLFNAIPVASPTTLGLITVGSGLTMTGSVLSANATSNYTLPTASPTVLGGVKVDGTTIVINGSGIISSTGSGGSGYTLPPATINILGGVKQGGVVLIDGTGVISVPLSTVGTPGAMQLGTGLDVALGAGRVSVTYGTTLGTSTQGNDTRVVNAAQLTGAAFTGAVTLNGVAAASQTYVTSQGYLTSSTLPTANSTTLGGVKPDGTSLTNSAGVLSVTYGSTTNTAIQGNVLSTLATLSAPAFTGVATFAGIPTISATMPGGTANTTQIPTMAWVQTAVTSGVTGVTSVAGNAGVVTLAQLVTAGVAPINNATHTGTLTSSTANVFGGTTTITGTTTIATGLTVSGNPTFSGNPIITGTMPATTTNSNAIPTMAWVQGAVVGGTAGVTNLILTNGTRTGSLTLATLVAGGIAPLASPTFTGTVTIPTGASIADYLTSALAATTYATNANATLTGVPTGPSAVPALGSSTNQLATLAFVHQEVNNTVSGSVNNGNGTAGVVSISPSGVVGISNAYPMPVFVTQQPASGQTFTFFAPVNVTLTGAYLAMTNVTGSGITISAAIRINGTTVAMSTTPPSGLLSITTSLPSITSLLATPTVCQAGQVIQITITESGTFPTNGTGSVIIQLFATYA